MKSKELKKYNLPEDRILLAVIDAKPNVTIVLLFILGMALFIFKQYIWGTSILLFSFVLAFLLPKRVLIEFFHEYLVLYNHANQNDCEIIYYDEVSKWKYSLGLSYDTLSITLIDDSIHMIDGFSKLVFESLMNKYLKDKKEKPKKQKK